MSRPVEPYPEDMEDAEAAKGINEWIDLESLRQKINNS